MSKKYNTGEQNGRHKLNKQQVLAIRRYFATPKEFRSKTMWQVAYRLGVSIWTIRKIVEGKTWQSKMITPTPSNDYSHVIDEYTDAEDDMPS